MRQARIMPNLTRTEIMNLKHENLTRYNRSFEVFRKMRGTSPYYEHAKKDLMACLRQRGSPNIFFTMACAEYKWDTLIQEILQVKERRQVDLSEIAQMNSSEKNKLLSENAVISTVHFHKRVEKIFRVFKKCEIFDPYLLEDYYIRVEFQARGAPHIHCLLWLNELDESDGKWKPMNTMYMGKSKLTGEQYQSRILEMENYARSFISASISNVKCKSCKESEKEGDMPSSSDVHGCPNCNKIKERINTFNNHICGFSCHKKKKMLTIKSSEGHGALDGKIKNDEKSNYLLCRFNYPQFPMKDTTFIAGLPKDINDDELIGIRKDFKMIKKYLIRQTGYNQGKREENESWKRFKDMTFNRFLEEVGMFSPKVNKKDPVQVEKALERYKLALSASIKGTGAIFIKRNPCDVFTNNFNPHIMEIHEANHDMQMVVDPYSCCEYVCDYLTKGEAGVSKIFQAVNEDGKDLSNCKC